MKWYNNTLFAYFSVMLIELQSHIVGERFSVALQSLAKPDAIFDYKFLDDKIVGKCYENFQNPTPAGKFVSDTSATRISSNFPYCAKKFVKQP